MKGNFTLGWLAYCSGFQSIIILVGHGRMQAVIVLEKKLRYVSLGVT